MNGGWGRRWPFFAGVGGLALILIGAAADLLQLLTWAYGAWALAGLILLALIYKAGEWGHREWRRYLAVKSRLNDVLELILKGARADSTTILLCATTRLLLRQPGQIRVSGLCDDHVIILDLSQVPLRPDDALVGIHFAITGHDDGRERAKGVVERCPSPASRACVRLYEQTALPRVGDLARAIEPPGATDLARLLGHVIFVIQQP